MFKKIDIPNSVLMTASFYSNVVYLYNVCLDHTDGRLLKKFGILKYVSAELLYLHLFTEFLRIFETSASCVIVYLRFGICTTIGGDKVNNVNPYIPTHTMIKIKWLFAIITLADHFVCGLMSDVVICKQRNGFGHT